MLVGIRKGHPACKTSYKKNPYFVWQLANPDLPGKMASEMVNVGTC